MVKQFSGHSLLHGSNNQCSDILYCGICRTTIECMMSNGKKRVDLIKKHLNSNKHKDQLSSFGVAISDQDHEPDQDEHETSILDRSSDAQSKHDEDLTRLMAATGTPFWRVSHPLWGMYINEWISLKVKRPENYFRTYLPIVYFQEVAKIREMIGTGHVLVTVDETTDTINRAVINVLVGKLSDEPSKSKLIYVGFEDENPTGEIVKDHVMAALEVLWPFGIQHNQVRGLLSDSAAYMIGKNNGAGVLLKQEFPFLLHVTCVVHMLHNVCKFAIQKVHPKAEIMASLLTQVLCRSKPRRALWVQVTGKEVHKSAIETRFCSVLNYIHFVSDNWRNFGNFVEQLEPQDSKEKKVPRLKHMIFDPIESGILTSDIQALDHLRFLSIMIVKLQSEKLPVQKAITKLDQIQLELSNLVKDEKIDQSILDYFKKAREKNHGLKCLLDNEQKYFPLNTMSVERSFSLYKETFTPRRHRTKESTLEMLMVVRYNNFSVRENDDIDVD